MKEMDMQFVADHMPDGRFELDLLVTSSMPVYEILNEMAIKCGRQGKSFDIVGKRMDSRGRISYLFPLDIRDEIYFGWYHIRIENEMYLKRGRGE